ncbi:MAG: DNA/RNA nuclease SfsA [Roseburia sp.]
MQYRKIREARFCSRPNRFVAKVKLDGAEETVHVKNTGRCRELLLPDSRVILAESDNPDRKTRYDLIAVYKESLGWVNIDSQAPNHVAAEWLSQQEFTYVKPEYRYGDSRIDFYMERREEKYLMEVKGCTLEVDGIGYFPDAPTERGVKHLRELTRAIEQGYHAIAAFVVQMEGIEEVRANVEMHPAFGEALDTAREAGVEILALCCKVTPDSLVVDHVQKLS